MSVNTDEYPVINSEEIAEIAKEYSVDIQWLTDRITLLKALDYPDYSIILDELTRVKTEDKTVEIVRNSSRNLRNI